jgi:hypothetical protein
MNKKSLRTLILFLAVFGLLFTANAFAGNITFTGRTYVDGVQVPGVTVQIYAIYEKEDMSNGGARIIKRGPYTAVSGSNGEYYRTFNSPAGYMPNSAEIYSYSMPVYPDDVCQGLVRQVVMSWGANRRHVYVYCYDIPEPPY